MKESNLRGRSGTWRWVPGFDEGIGSGVEFVSDVCACWVTGYELNVDVESQMGWTEKWVTNDGSCKNEWRVTK